MTDERLTVGTTGAFYLVGHGIEPEAADRLFALTRRFFALPESGRRSIEMANSPRFRGYTALANEQGPARLAWTCRFFCSRVRDLERDVLAAAPGHRRAEEHSAARAGRVSAVRV